MFEIKKVFKNMSYSLGVQLFGKVSTALLSLYLARKLGSEVFGIYNFAMSFLGIFSLLSELGISTLLTRDIAQRPKRTQTYFINSLIIKILLCILTIMVICIAVSAMNYDDITNEVIILLMIALMISSINSVYMGVINGHQEMQYSAKSTFLERTIVVLFGYIYLSIYADLLGFAIITIFASIIQFLYLLLVTRKYELRFNRKRIKRKILYSSFIRSIPLGITAYVILFYYKIDIVLLGIIKGNKEVAYYSAGYMLLNFLSFIPSTMMSVFFPTLSHLYKHHKEKYIYFVNQIYKIIVLCFLPITIIICSLAPKIIIAVFGSEYSNSILLLQILIWTFSIMFFNSFFGNIAVIEDKAKSVTIVVSLAAVFNLILNLIFIPKYGYIGSAIITVCSELIPLFLYQKLVNTKLVNHKKNYTIALIGNLVMILALFLSNDFQFILQGILGISVYVLVLILLKVYSKNEIKQMLNISKLG